MLLLRFKQTRVFDRDHRMVGEVLKKRDLLGGERSDFPSPHENDADRHALMQQWSRKCCPVAFAFCVAASGRKFPILRRKIANLNRPTIAGRSSNYPLAICRNA